MESNNYPKDISKFPAGTVNNPLRPPSITSENLPQNQLLAPPPLVNSHPELPSNVAPGIPSNSAPAAAMQPGMAGNPGIPSNFNPTSSSPMPPIPNPIPENFPNPSTKRTAPDSAPRLNALLPPSANPGFLVAPAPAQATRPLMPRGVPPAIPLSSSGVPDHDHAKTNFSGPPVSLPSGIASGPTAIPQGSGHMLGAAPPGCQQALPFTPLNGDPVLQNHEQMLLQGPAMLSQFNSIAEYFAAKGDFPNAIKYYERITQMDPENGAAWTALGHCYLLTDDLQKAFTSYQKALYSLPDVRDPQLWYGIGLLYDKFETYEYAIPTLMAVLKLAPNFAQKSEVLYKLAVIYGKTYQLDQALTYFKLAMLESAGAPAISRRIDILTKMGICYIEKKEYESAKKTFEAAMTSSEPNYKTLQHLAWCEFLMGSYSLALEHIGQAIKQKESDGDGYYIRGRILLVTEKYPEAKEEFQQAIIHNQSRALYRAALGIANCLLKQYGEAYKNFLEATHCDPNIAEIWYDIGILYEIHQQYSEGIVAYQKALEANPEYTEANTRRVIISSDQASKVAPPAFVHPEFRIPDSLVPLKTFASNAKSKKSEKDAALPNQLPNPQQPNPIAALFNNMGIVSPLSTLRPGPASSNPGPCLPSPAAPHPVPCPSSCGVAENGNGSGVVTSVNGAPTLRGAFVDAEGKLINPNTNGMALQADTFAAAKAIEETKIVNTQLFSAPASLPPSTAMPASSQAPPAFRSSPTASPPIRPTAAPAMPQDQPKEPASKKDHLAIRQSASQEEKQLNNPPLAEPQTAPREPIPNLHPAASGSSQPPPAIPQIPIPLEKPAPRRAEEKREEPAQQPVQAPKLIQVQAPSHPQHHIQRAGSPRLTAAQKSHQQASHPSSARAPSPPQPSAYARVQEENEEPQQVPRQVHVFSRIGSTIESRHPLP